TAAAMVAIETFAGFAEAPWPGRSRAAQRNFGDNAFTCASQSSSAQVKPCTKITLGLCVPVTRKLIVPLAGCACATDTVQRAASTPAAPVRMKVRRDRSVCRFVVDMSASSRPCAGRGYIIPTAPMRGWHEDPKGRPDGPRSVPVPPALPAVSGRESAARPERLRVDGETLRGGRRPD